LHVDRLQGVEARQAGKIEQRVQGWRIEWSAVIRVSVVSAQGAADGNRPCPAAVLFYKVTISVPRRVADQRHEDDQDRKTA
jgi:hypothetical protein